MRSSAVPWARVASSLVVVHDTPQGEVVALLPATFESLSPGSNVAGEPRDEVTIRCPVDGDDVRPVRSGTVRLTKFRAALGRSIMLAGAAQLV